MKQNVQKKAYKIIKNGGMKTAWSGVILIVLTAYMLLYRDTEISDIIDFTIFSSIIFAVALNSLSELCEKWLLNQLEDNVKLLSSYESLKQKYNVEFYSYNNGKLGAEKETAFALKKHQLQKRVYFPVVQNFPLKGCCIEIDDSEHMYQIPDEICEHFDEIFSAHNTSKIYNQLHIRVDHWELRENVFHLKTSRTSFYNSLVTNRAMDFPWSNGLTVRDVLEYGPFFHELRESALSNHLGFNGFIISNDGYIPFVKRSKSLSTGKRVYGTSVSASLKTKYALDGNGKFNYQGLIKAILCEIEDKLKIPADKLEELNSDKNFIAAYRDLAEGGKPQFVFFLKSYWSKDVIQQHFCAGLKRERSDKNSLEKDRISILWIPKDRLSALYVGEDKIIYNKRKYPMLYTASASLGMLIEYMQI